MTVIYTVSGKDPGTSSAGVTGGPGTLSYAIAQINASDPNGGPYVINITGNVTLSGPLSPILGSVTINGNGNTIDAGGATRIFFVGTDNATMTSAQGNPASTTSIISQRQQVTIENVTLKGGLAQGGSGAVGGGGGLGAGGALFVNQSADVTLSSVNFSGDKAIGGSSSGTANPRGGSGGGGGLGGSGSASGGGGGLFGNAAVAGGGLFGNAGGKGGGGFSGDGTGATGNAGNLSVYGLKGSGGSSGQPSTPTYTSTTYTSGGANGGGGGDATPRNVPIGGGGGFGGGSYMNGGPGSGGFGGGGGGIQRGINGGNGGFGGGGGYAAYSGGNGGFGGGGGGGYNNNGGNGGFGGGGGANGPFKGGNGGFGAGGGGGVNSNFNGSPGFGASSAGGGIGGGGAGMGGAVFVASGGTLQINGTSTETGSSATGGFSGDGRQASGLGAGIFFQGTPGGAPASLTFGAGNQTIASAITDQNGSGGSGASNGFGGTGGATALVKSGGGTLTLSSGASTYSGGTEIQGGTLDLTVSTTVVRQMVTMGPAGTGVISFHAAAGQTATLALDAAAQPASGGTFGYTLADFGRGDTLDLKGFGPSGSFVSYGNGYILVSGSAPGGGAAPKITTEYFTLSNPEYTSFQTQSDGAGGTLITAVVCFASGTLIRTARGQNIVDVAVEALAVGDLVVTSSGMRRPIEWLGHRTIGCRNHPRPHEVMPVRIAADAFGPNRPARDLFVSPGHSICVDVVDEVLIPAIALVNGATITQVEVDEVTYWHVELDAHDIILAENLACESYLDMDNRAFFAESKIVDLDASPDTDPLRRTHADYCRPFHLHGPLVDAVRAQMRARALTLGWYLSAGIDAHLEVDGRRIDPVVRYQMIRFLIPAKANDVWLVSRAVRPCDSTDSGDARALGLDIGALYIEDAFSPRSIALDDPLLDTGFLRIEGGSHRWTDGRARLPVQLWDSCADTFFLRIDLASPPVARWVTPELSTLFGAVA